MRAQSLVGLVIAATAFTPSAAVAQSTAPGPRQASQANDPGERICETVTVLGSRLAKKRVCATRAEWEQMRLRDRQEVERAQMSPCVRQQNTASGRASC